MRNLLWKEWHEQSWKLAFTCILLGSFSFIGFQLRIVLDETVNLWVCFIGVTLLPVLASTGLIAPERAEGSFESLLVMPIAPWKVLASKTIMGIVLCSGPMLVAAVITLLIAGGREMDASIIFQGYARSTVAGLLLFFWMLGSTSRIPSEARAALVAVGILVCWLIATVGLSNDSVPHFLLAISPLGYMKSWVQETPSTVPVALEISIQLLFTILLWTLTLRFLTRVDSRA